MTGKRKTGRIAAACVGLGFGAVLGVVAWQVHESQRLASAPVAVAWEKQACAHCHMHLSERHFAVQLHTTAGEVLHFDDPGCFLWFAETAQPSIHEVWFHHSRDERWLRRDQVGFVPAASTPMNFGWAAVDQHQPGAVGSEVARARVLARDSHPGAADG